MTIWRFSDGTVAELGGNIDGPSLFAQELRADLEHDEIHVGLYAGPGGGVILDRNDATLFDAWLQQEMERPYRRDEKLRLLERPDSLIGELPPDPRDFSDMPADALI